MDATKQYNFDYDKSNRSKLYLNETIDPSLFSFEDTSITHSKFYNCILENVNFKRAAVTGSIFEKCKFYNCNLDDADFQFCEFKDCEIKTHKISGCSFNNSDFIEVKFEEIKFACCTLTNSLFDNCYLNKTNIEYSTLEGACFSKCRFENLDWRNLNLEYVEFIESEMNEVILPFHQIPYIFGLLQYISLTNDKVLVATKNSLFDINTYFEHGIPTLLNEYKEKGLYFPMSNIYLFGKDRDVNEAFDCIQYELNSLASTRDYRRIKFCCKLIAMSNQFTPQKLNKLYKIIADMCPSVNGTNAEMKSFSRHIGEIRNILFSKKKEPNLKIAIKTNIKIENALRFSTLINLLQRISKPNHSEKVFTTITLSQNSPLIITIEVRGDARLFSNIIQSYWILDKGMIDDYYQYPLIDKLDAYYGENNSTRTIENLVDMYNQLKEDDIQITILEYYINDCEALDILGNREYYIHNSLVSAID